jgi:hypothetical protein
MRHFDPIITVSYPDQTRGGVDACLRQIHMAKMGKFCRWVLIVLRWRMSFNMGELGLAKRRLSIICLPDMRR